MKSYKSFLVKGVFSLFIVTLLSLVKTEIVQAETFLSGATIEVNDANSVTDIDWDAIISALDGKQIVDGTSIAVGDSYRLDCEVIITPTSEPSKSAMASSNSELLNATTSSVTNDYTATCNVYIYISGVNTYAALLSHTVSVIYFDNNLIHISSGSLSANPSSPFTGYAYGYNIVNTDGTYSYAYGMVQLYNNNNHLYYYYGANASVTPGNSPSFSFSQV